LGPQEQHELLAGRYRVDGLLGRGGMSEVYHGYDERLDRRIAIKVLRPPAYAPAAPDSAEALEILDAQDRERKRFLREIRVTAQLEHPGIPAVYDTGIEALADGGSRLWLVMQLLRDPLWRCCSNRRITRRLLRHLPWPGRRRSRRRSRPS
jgi:serine/threonine protein kinase